MGDSALYGYQDFGNYIQFTNKFNTLQSISSINNILDTSIDNLQKAISTEDDIADLINEKYSKLSLNQNISQGFSPSINENSPTGSGKYTSIRNDVGRFSFGRRRRK